MFSFTELQQKLMAQITEYSAGILLNSSPRSLQLLTEEKVKVQYITLL